MAFSPTTFWPFTVMELSAEKQNICKSNQKHLLLQFKLVMDLGIECMGKAEVITQRWCQLLEPIIFIWSLLSKKA
jgi:hypothetical protein